MDKKTLFIFALCALAGISLAANGFLIYTLEKNSEAYSLHQVNQKVLAFRNMFEEKVLLSDQPIDFDTRLSMETAVRALNDQGIFDQWQKFTNSQTQADATAQAKALLELLIQKTSY